MHEQSLHVVFVHQIMMWSFDLQIVSCLLYLIILKQLLPLQKTVTAVAACFVAVVIAFSGIFGGLSNGKLGNITAQNGSYGNVSFESPDRGTYDKLFSTSDKTVYNQLSDTMNGTSSSVTTDRKIVKTAALHIKTNDYESHIVLYIFPERLHYFGSFLSL